MIRHQLSLVLAICLGMTVGACGDDSGNPDSSVADSSADTMLDIGNPDTGTADTGTADSRPGDSGMDASGACTIENFAVEFELAEFEMAENYFLYSGDSGDMDPIDTIYLELYTDAGAMLAPQTFVFSGENYDVCSTCLTIEANCTGGVCTQTFLVTSGNLAITAAAGMQDAPFQANLSDLVLTEVTIDENTNTSTPVAGGDIWCIDLIEIDTTIDLVMP